MDKESANAARLNETPRVLRLLLNLRSKLRTSVLLHGSGTILCILSAWLAFAFLADWGLRVPLAFRVFNGLMLAGLFSYFFWRNLWTPLRAIPRLRGLALLFERNKPELDEVLSSAIEFQSDAGSGNPILIQRVLKRADQVAAGLDSSSVLDKRPMLQRLSRGLLAAAFLALFAVQQPMYTEIFFNRLLGGELSWPRRTRLSIDLPGLEPVALELDGQGQAGVLRLRVARGTDIPVLIRAEGQVPDQVDLHFEGGRSLQLKRTGNNVFRTMLSSCQENISFHASGGDDLEGRPRVEVIVLQPPDVQGIAVQITPPAYTGEGERLVFNNDVEVLSGSTLRVHASTFPVDASGVARLLPEDKRLTLMRGEFPTEPLSSEDGQALQGDAPDQSLYFDHIAFESLGFQFLLEDGSGLTNPDPGLFQIKVEQDRSPEILVISPARSELEVALGGVIPLRARFADDYGLLDASWRTKPAGPEAQQDTTQLGSFQLRQLAQGELGKLDQRLLLGQALIEVDQLGTSETPAALDQRYVIEISATDTRQPNANLSQSLPIRALVVTPETLIRRMQERLALAGREARKLSELQTEKRSRVEELMEIFDVISDGDLQTGAEGAALASALAGQRRVLGDAEALARSLARITEDILFARLDSGADQLLNFHLSQLEVSGDVGFLSAPWRALAASARAGQLGPEGFARNLVLLVDLALSISAGSVQEATLALDLAERALDLATRIDALAKASELQTQALGSMELLIEKLAEWDNFQNVLALMRDILNRQKNLIERTQQYAKEAEK